MQVQSRSGGRLRSERGRAELLDLEPEPRRLLLQERPRPRRAGLVHLEVHDHVPVESDVLRVLSPDLQDRLDLRHESPRALRLRGDLVLDNVRAKVVAGQIPPRPRGPGKDLAYLEPRLLHLPPNAPHRILDCRQGIAIRSPVIARQDTDLSVHLRDQSGLGADRTDVHAECGDGYTAREVALCRLLRQDLGLREPYGGRAFVLERLHSPLLEQLQRSSQVHLGLRPEGRPDRAQNQVVFRNDDPVLGDIQLPGQESTHRRVQRHPADEEDPILEILPSGDGGAVVSADRLVDSRRDPLSRRPLLVEVNDVGLGEHCAAARQRSRFLGVVRDLPKLLH